MTEEKFIHIGVCPAELLDMACLMAQDIQEYIDAGEESGSDMSSSKELLEDFNKLYSKTNRAWQNSLAKKEEKNLPFMLREQAAV